MQQYSPDGTRLERTSWRCEKISKRHREWGCTCPAVDLDFVLAEYHYGKPVALIEYKDKHARMPDFNHPTYMALTSLADNYALHPLPFVVVFYCPDDWWFTIYPVNDAAKKFYGHVDGQTISEQRFVTSLYLLRKRTLTNEDKHVIEKLNNRLPVENLELEF